MTKDEISFCMRLARGIAAQFGEHCEIAVHDLETKEPEHSIVAIENGEITGRKIGDGPSHIVLETMQAGSEKLEDRLGYLTRTRDGKILRSSTIYVRNAQNKITGIFSINFDITMMLAYQQELQKLTASELAEEEPEPITQNVVDLLEELISESIRLIGKPVALMTKEDKLRAVRFLHDSGALLITKSGQRICDTFHFSKYTLYNYLEEIKTEEGTGD
jgi:predicted transcriptional regulator YheO